MNMGYGVEHGVWYGAWGMVWSMGYGVEHGVWNGAWGMVNIVDFLMNSCNNILHQQDIVKYLTVSHADSCDKSDIHTP